MKVLHRVVKVFATSALAFAIVFAVRISSAHAGPIQNFKDCMAEGASIKACCLGAGGTYSKDSNGAETCVIVEKKTAFEPGQDRRPSGLIAIQIPPSLIPTLMLEIGPALACDPNTVGCPG